MKTRGELQDLLGRRIRESGLSTGHFAREVLRREPATVRAWLTGRKAIPHEVADFLENPRPAPWPRRLDPPGITSDN